MRALLLVFLLACAARADLDRKTVKALEEFGARWWQARPKTKFEAWDPAVRRGLLAELDALGPMPEGSLERVVDALWRSVRKYGPDGKGGGKLELETPYGTMWAYVKGAGRSKGLIVGLHGGGEGAGSADEPAGTWQHKSCMGMYPQGLVLTGDNWNTVHGEKHILTLIEIAKAQHDIDPDRVYVMGFSMGGTGSWHMAGRFPDLFAGAAPCAGVLMASPKSAVPTKEEVGTIQYGLVPNVRNLAMYSFIGLEDRNCPPGTFLYLADVLADLKKSDPEGYGKVRLTFHEGLAHAFPPGEPQACIDWLTEQERDTFPKKIVWEYCSDPFPLPKEHDKTARWQRHWFYWIRHDAPEDRMEITAVRDGNTIALSTVSYSNRGLRVLLNPEMIDVGAEVVVTLEGKEIYRGKPQPTFRDVVESLDGRLDRRLVFDRSIPVGE